MPIALVSSEDEKAWHRERARRVTKSDAVQLVGAGIDTWKRIWNEKQNPEPSFKGNAATEAGHRLEPLVIKAARAAGYGVEPCGVLYAHETVPMHAATPDATVFDEGEWGLVEVKTTVEDWSNGLPRKIILDALWQKYVMDAAWVVVAWWQLDAQKQPLKLDGVRFVEIEPDAEATQSLIDGANAYLAWVDAGRPEFDDETGLPIEILHAIESVNRGKAAEARIREWCEQNAEPVNLSLRAGSIRYAITESSSFDKAAFLAAEPSAAATISAADKLLKSAQKDPTYRKPTVRTSLTIAPPKEDDEVAA